jgi:hypothetical protein
MQFRDLGLSGAITVVGCTSACCPTVSPRAFSGRFTISRILNENRAIGSNLSRGLLLFGRAVRYLHRSDARTDRGSTPPWWCPKISDDLHDEPIAQKPRYRPNPIRASGTRRARSSGSTSCRTIWLSQNHLKASSIGSPRY